MEAENGCSICQKTPAQVCKCTGERFCERHMGKHLKKEGKHNVVDPQEVKLKVSIIEESPDVRDEDTRPRRHSKLERKRTKLSKDGPKPVVKRVLTKVDFVQMLKAEIDKIRRFHDTTLDGIASMAERLVTQIISESRELIADINRICVESEGPLTQALAILESLAEDAKIPLNNPVLVRLHEAREEEGYEMLSCLAEIKEVTVVFKSAVSYKVEWAPVASMTQMRGYMDTHGAEMHHSIQALFEIILSEHHYTTEVIKLSKAELTLHNGIDHLTLILPFFSEVKELKLGGNQLGADEGRALFPIIGNMQKLTKLHMQKNDLKASGGRELSLILGNLTKLRDLDLSGNNLGAEGIRHISGVIKKLVNLKQLHLQDNNLGSDSAKHLAQGLRQLKSLKVVHLEGNSFSAEDIRALNNSNASGCKIYFNKE